MYIKSLVLDGFKSYGKRTEINGFDHQFNAITGLNGTGKSNILDAICFVLGISQLSNVRVGSLQDLVYKSGQSNIMKATVSVTFDNRDKTQSPVGFMECDEITVSRQVLIGGKNKYMINGVIVQNKRVYDLFCSVHLNVNNPHFLIMQGRITKVLNMKPPEILSMIEEAAGTKMYEAKRQQTQKIIEKKDMKLLELSKLGKEEVTPKLSKLREERKMFLEFQRIERELEHMTNIYSCWQCIQTKRIMEEAVKDLQNRHDEVAKIENKILENKNAAEEIDKKIAEHHEKDSDKNEELKAAEAKLKGKEKELATLNAAEKSARDNVVAAEKNLKKLVKSLHDDEASLTTKETEMNKLNDMFQSLKDAEAAGTAAFLASQKKFEAINAGMEIGDDGEAATLQELLMTAKQNAAQASTEINQASMQLEHCQSQLAEKQKELKSLSTEFRKDKSELDNLENQVKNIQRNIDNLKFDENSMNDLRNAKRKVTYDIQNLIEKIERFEAQYPQTKFDYQDPEKNFNRRSVKGVVCKLIKLKDYNTALAIETGIGGKLFNVIVDNEITSKKLLKNGQLKYRTTIIPLNKIRGSSISPNVVAHAQRLVGNENVQTALSLVEYDKELQAAMKYISGGFFVCRDLNIARKVAFEESIKCTCVTLEADVVNPAGVLSGGAVSKTASFLVLLREYNEFSKMLRSKEQELKQIDADLAKLAETEAKYNDLRQKHQIRSHELAVCQQRVQQTSHFRRQEEVDNLKKTIAELSETIKSNKEKEKMNNAKALEIENKIKNSKGSKEQQLKAAEAEMKRLKKEAENSKNLWIQKEQDYESLKLEISDLQQAINTDKEQIQKCEENIIEMNRKQKEAAESTKIAQADVSSLQIEYKELKSAFAAKNKEIQKMLQQQTELMAQVSEYEFEIQKRSHGIAELEAKCKEYKAKEAEATKKLGDNATNREIAEMDEKAGYELGKRIKRMQGQRDTLRRTVNAKAQSMFEQEEKQHLDLLKRKEIIESDKAKMLSVIDDIDKKKIETLNIASADISKNFGLIFSTLLPGATAKLQPEERKSLLDGLEIKVCIGGIWKENLSELSGGQKSLVALSLILAMLLFKPAPIYILDEVDAALDLSHTQNIGTMLRKHFKNSQFIIVSLKDGMFNNANVLFRTQFVDGMSAVTRNVNKSRS